MDVQIEDAPNANASHKVYLVWLVCVKKRCPRALAPVPWNAGIYIGRVARQRIAEIRRFPCDSLLAGPECAGASHWSPPGFIEPHSVIIETSMGDHYMHGELRRQTLALADSALLFHCNKN